MKRSSDGVAFSNFSFVAGSLEILAWIIPFLGMFMSYQVWFSCSHFYDNLDGKWHSLSGVGGEAFLYGLSTFVGSWILALVVAALGHIVRGTNES